MKKIKLLGIVIVGLLIALIGTLLFSNHNNKINTFTQNTINKHKFATQEIAKDIFFIYKHKNNNPTHLDKSMLIFNNNIQNINSTTIQTKSKKFYEDIQKFKRQTKHSTAYTNIILEKTVKEIYNTNISLIKELNKLSKKLQTSSNIINNYYTNGQYLLIFLIFLSFVYLLIYIWQGGNSFEILIKKIDNSIKSIDQVEQNVEKYLKDIELPKDEDIIIESLEELMKTNIKLKQLNLKLDC